LNPEPLQISYLDDFNLTVYPNVFKIILIIPYVSNVQTEIDNYIIDYISFGFHVAGPNLSKPFVRIYLVNNQKYIGRINFDDELIRANSVDNNGNVTLNYHLDSFNDIINILRYEKPLYVYFNTSDLTGGIATSLEHVGEEET
jgi:hypothetical protein